ncbi:MAG TPA: DUF6531 domain-containing protein [Dehalococcoidia bacterium]|nr:DUF6531 domain-containing protein [Dehalococcoidia bacterium]
MRSRTRRLHPLLGLLAGLVGALLCGATLGALPAAAQTGAPGTPALLAPANGQLDVSPTGTLSWTQPAGASPGVTVYSLFLSDWNTNQNLPTLTTTSTSLAVPQSEALQNSHRYFWSVKACNGTNCSARSGEWDFFVQGPAGAPDYVTLLSATPETTPTFSWSQPAGATAGSTVYVVGLQDDATGDFLPDLPPTTNLYATAPTSENLVLGHTYDWAVNACNGDFCSGFTDQWTFTTATAPGAALEISPANGASVTLPTAQNPNALTLSWSQPAGAIPGTTFYIVSLYDPYGEPQGHFLGDLHTTTSLSTTVPASEGLLPGQSYSWNVQACNGAGACAGYSATWWSFTSPLPALATASGAGVSWIVNPDFGGTPQSYGGAPIGWSVGPSGPPPNYQYWSTALSLDFSGACSGGGSCSSFRLGYELIDNLQAGVNNGSAVQVKWYNSQTGVYTQIYYDSRPGPTPGNTWVEADVQVPSSLGAPGQIGVVLIGADSDTGVHYPSAAYLDRADGPTATGVPAAGLAAAPRFPKALSAAAGAGVDTVTGALNLTATDLSVPGVAGTLSFTRAYSTRALVAPGQTAPLGDRWAHNWQSSAQWVNNATGVVANTPGGGVYYFTYLGQGQGGGVFAAPKGVNATLSSGSGFFYLTTADQRTYTFSCNGCQFGQYLSGAQPPYTLNTITDRAGNAIDLTHDGSGNITLIKDRVSGRYLSIAYQGGRIVSVNDNAGSIVFYGYTGSALTGVGTVLGGTIGYGYDAAGNHWLTSATDPQGVTSCNGSSD